MAIVIDSINDDPDAGGIPPSEKGAADGVATLDATTHIPLSQLPSSIIGGLIVQGEWNANTNSPDLTLAGAKVAGHAWVVGVAGSTNLDGITDWKVNDVAWYDGNANVWRKTDNTEPPASEVINDSGVAGAYVDDALDTLNSGKLGVYYDLGMANLIVNGPRGTFDAGAIQSVWGNICRLDNTSKFVPADASVENTTNGMLVFATQTRQNASGVFAMPGCFIRDDSWTLTRGGLIYLSETTGLMTQTKPTTVGAFVRILGYAYTDKIIWFDPDMTYVKVK